MRIKSMLFCQKGSFDRLIQRNLIKLYQFMTQSYLKLVLLQFLKVTQLLLSFFYPKINLQSEIYIIVFMIRAVHISIICVLLAVTLAQTPPTYPDQYEIEFEEKATIGPLGGNTTGKIYLDAKSNQELITRKNGHHDRYCGSVYKFADTPCNHYVSGGKRYLDFPEKNFCCYCCDSAHGCGIVAPDWLVKANAIFLGSEKLQDGEYYVKWNAKGLQDNFFYHHDDEAKTPRRLVQGGDDTFNFYNYKMGISDPSVFKVPSYCTATCGLTTICAALRGQQLLRSE